MRKILQIATILLPLTAAAQNRILLRPNVSIRGDSISLADLLPANAPESLRVQANEIALGRAPNIGFQRTLQRAEIARAISSEMAAALEIPQSVTVTRWARKLTRDEILAAINKSLAANHASSNEPLSPSDITFDSPIYVTEDAPALSVVRFEPRANGGGTHVALWTVSEPRTPPFWVTVDHGPDLEPKPEPPSAANSTDRNSTALPANSDKVTALNPLVPTISGRHAGTAPSPKLIHVGDAIELVVQGNGMRIATKATALQSGADGQCIRVKSANTEKVLVSRIVGAQSVEIDY